MVESSSSAPSRKRREYHFELLEQSKTQRATVLHLIGTAHAKMVVVGQRSMAVVKCPWFFKVGNYALDNVHIVLCKVLFIANTGNPQPTNLIGLSHPIAMGGGPN
jgi:hypothetical protein